MAAKTKENLARKRKGKRGGRGGGRKLMEEGVVVGCCLQDRKEMGRFHTRLFGWSLATRLRHVGVTCIYPDLAASSDIRPLTPPLND
jgi:hypothetical protein